MEIKYWVTFVLIALVVGLVIGFGLASKPSRIPDLERQIRQLTQENADLRARLSASVAPTAPSGGAAPSTFSPPAKP